MDDQFPEKVKQWTSKQIDDYLKNPDGTTRRKQQVQAEIERRRDLEVRRAAQARRERREDRTLTLMEGENRRKWWLFVVAILTLIVAALGLLL